LTYLEILTAVAAIVVPMISIQTFWIARGFSSLERELGGRIDGVERSLGQRIDRVEGRLDRVEERLDHIDRTVIPDHTERITRPESRP
jgi:hypothetical protein